MRTVLLISLLLGQEAIAMPDAISVGSARQLFIDRKFIATSDHVVLTQNSPHRLGPVILPDKPWEAEEIGFCASVMKHDGAYWLFYRATALDGSAGVCLATSHDGVHWDKPDLGIVEFEGSKHNNIVFWGVGEAVVFLDPHGSADARFKAIVALHWPDPKLAGLYVYTSPDGLHWTPGAERVTSFLPDTANQAMWDWRLNKYVAYLRVWNPLRKIGRVEMDDILAPWPYDKSVKPFHIWGPDKIPVSSTEVPTVFGLDDQDPPNCDVYNAAAVEYPWADDAYFLFPSEYQHFPEPPVGKWGNDGLLDIILAASRDGVHFSRITRSPYLSLTTTGKQSKSMYMAVGMVRRGDEILQYYAGYETTHGDPRRHGHGLDHPIGSLCCGVQRLDGFVSADFAYGGGTMTTPPMVFEGSKLELNINCSAMGSARVELRDANDKVIPGFTLGDADVIYGNEVHHVVSWKGKSDVSALAGKAVRIHIAARDAKLYAFQFSE